MQLYILPATHWVAPVSVVQSVKSERQRKEREVHQQPCARRVNRGSRRSRDEDVVRLVG